jgi:hypothetical protein
MSAEQSKEIVWFLWPFAAVWKFLAFVLALTGRVLLAVLGLGLMAVGVVLTITVAGAPIGVPIAVLGLLLMIRSIF